MNYVLLFAGYGLALFAAFRMAGRLAANAPLHHAALTLLLFIVNLIVPATYAGIINQLTMPGLIVAGALLWGGEILLASRLNPLENVAFVRTPLAEGPYVALWIGYALVIAYTGFNLIHLVMDSVPVANSDAVWVYTPDMINFVQAGSLNTNHGILTYFPAAHSMIFVWEIAFTRAISQIPALQGLLSLNSLLYTALITQFLLRRAPSLARHLVTLAALSLLLSSELLTDLTFGTGKNDILVIVCGLASAYYLLRYWNGMRDTRFLILVGLACGLSVSTKISAAIWVVAISSAHLVLLVSKDRSRWLPQLSSHAVAVGVPLVIIGLPWVLRIALNPDMLVDSAAISAAGATYTIIRHWAHPLFTSLTLFWIVPYMFVAAGNLALLYFNERLRGVGRPITLALIVIGYAWLTLTPPFDWHLGAFYTTLIVGVIVLAAWLRNRRFAPVDMLVVMLMAQITMLLLAVTPYSAWIDHFTWNDGYFFGINYRYAGAAYPALLIANLALIAHVLTPASEAPDVDTSPGLSLPLKRYASIVLVGSVLAWLALPLLRGDPGAQLTSVQEHAALPTGAYTWLYEHVQGQSVYAINAPPLPLYGRNLANTVYYATPSHHGYFGDQAYQWGEVEALIDDYQIDYVVVSFAYSVFIQSRLLPSPEVDSEIALMRDHLDVVYEDAFVTIFATEYAGDSGSPAAASAHQVFTNGI